MRFKTFLAIWLWFTPVYAEDSPTSEALSRESVSSNTSELFAKVLALEENMREMTGKLQQYEHNVQELSKQLNELSSGSAITQSSSNKMLMKSCLVQYSSSKIRDSANPLLNYVNW